MRTIVIIQKSCLMMAFATLVSCAGHGKYTSEFLEEAGADRAKLRAATQHDAAYQLFQSGDMERALETVDDSITLDDQNAESYLLRARVLIEMGRTDASLKALQRGATLDKSNPEFSYYGGIAFERLGRMEDALAGYRAAATLDPARLQYALAAIDVMLELEQLDEARTFIAGLSNDLASTPGMRQAVGHIAMLEGNDQEAVRAFTEAAVMSPNDPVFREDLCHAQIAAREFAQAEATLNRLTEEKGYEDRDDLEHLHASCLIELDRPVEAKAILSRLTHSKDVDIDVEAWVKLIDVALMLRDDNLLNSSARRLMAIAPGRHEGYLALAIWQRRTGDLAGATVSIDRAVARAGDDPTPRQLQAVLRHEMTSASAKP